jgi:MoaA/NifB/PqqE/SkfB family radical SAM enzyme
MEWKDRFNSFNSDKIYLHSDKLQYISDWVNGKSRLPAPIEASFDPIHSCNLMCQHCNAHKYLDTGYRMSDEHILDLIRYLSDWGVKSICFGGGGEPTLHTKLQETIELTYSLGMESSLATNGTFMTQKLIDSIVKHCRYIGVSVDSACADTYKIGRKVNLFDVAIKNIERMVAKKTHCDIAYKFLIFDYNQHEIYEACKLAKKLGVQDFHVRPADFKHQGMGEMKRHQNDFDVELIEEQFELCHDIEDDNFRVYSIVHKFNPDFTPKRNFSQCYASPISIQLCADGNIYYCPDTRFMEEFKLGSHLNVDNIINVWGNDKHKKLVTETACSTCMSRCTFAVYNEVCERLFINTDDPMCRNFI